jgi:hypothetical protein
VNTPRAISAALVTGIVAISADANVSVEAAQRMILAPSFPALGRAPTPTDAHAPAWMMQRSVHSLRVCDIDATHAPFGRAGLAWGEPS